jgi:type IV pilus assembly protein PilQ
MWHALLALVLADEPKVSMDFVDADIHDVLRILAETGDLNIVVDDSVQGRVTVHLEDVEWQAAFDAILASQGLGAQRFGPNIVSVTPAR